MRRLSRQLPTATVIAVLGVPAVAFGQEIGSVYAGALVGISTLSADGRAVTGPDRAEVSLDKPENGLAINLLVGAHLSRYFTVQANYVWNRNDVRLFSSVAATTGGGFYQEDRTGSQHAVIADALLYFRALGNGVRPYLSTGVGLVRMTTGPPRAVVANGAPALDGEIAETRAALRVAVGIDLRIDDRWRFRYSFSETISDNPISARLQPVGQRNLANFQNLFGFVWHL